MKRYKMLPLGVTMACGLALVAFQADAQGRDCGSGKGHRHHRSGSHCGGGSKGGRCGWAGARAGACGARGFVATAPGYVLQVNSNPLYNYAPYNGAYGAVPYRTGIGYTNNLPGLYTYGPNHNSGFNPYLNGAYSSALVPANYYGRNAYSYSGVLGGGYVYGAYGYRNSGYGRWYGRYR